MGMYTGLRAKVKIKEEFRPVIAYLVSDDGDRRWADVAEEFPEYPFLREWADVWRNDFIPFGSLNYMPWDYMDQEWEGSFKDGIWTFQCSLKNYENEIETFVDVVLRRIVDVEADYKLYSLYEEDEEPTHIEL